MVRRGAEFAVNTFTSDEQSLPAVAVDAASGRFVVVWQSGRRTETCMG